jgi:hypothetical protein
LTLFLLESMIYGWIKGCRTKKLDYNAYMESPIIKGGIHQELRFIDKLDPTAVLIGDMGIENQPPLASLKSYLDSQGRSCWEYASSYDHLDEKLQEEI